MKPALESSPRRLRAAPPPLPGVEPKWCEGDLVPGTQYRYVRELGCGVQGLAIEVEHAFLGSRSAMKILRAQHVSRRSVCERVRNEARALVELRHPNIVRVTDGGMTAESEPRPFFVMELLKGDTLRALLKKTGGPLDLRRSLDVAIDILDALDHAHARHMVHRDVKPANIFLVRGGLTTRAVLLDFGIVSVVEPGVENRAGFSGTYEYAAPEQLDGYLTAQSDVYALATVLYLCLSGRHPFAGMGRDALAHAHRHVVPPLLEGVPAALSALVASALEKDPRRRPKSALAFAQKLRDVRKTLGPARPMLVSLSDTARVVSTDHLLRNLDVSLTLTRDETTCELETELAKTCLVKRPQPQDSTSILVAPWLPKKRRPEPTLPSKARPGRPLPQPSSSHVTVTGPAPQLLDLGGEPESLSAIQLDVSDVSILPPTVAPARRALALPPKLVAWIAAFFTLGALLSVLASYALR